MPFVHRSALLLSALGLLASALAAPPARAMDPRLFSVGVGTSIGVSSRDAPGVAGVDAVAELGVRVRGLYALGAELSLNLGGGTSAADQEPAFRSLLRFSGLLYVLPLEEVSVYAMGGMGAGEASDLLDPDGVTTSYHVGLGLEVPVWEGLSLGGEYLVVLPGPASVRQSFDRRVSALQGTIDAGADPQTVWEAEFGGEAPEDYVGMQNFEVRLSARWAF